jgi:Papain-like cysteine protease AvrRpt2
MMTFRLVWIALIATCLQAKAGETNASCMPALEASLDVTLRGQKTGLWCWAASAEMVMEYLGSSVEQCDEANYRFGHTDCCKTPTPAACIQAGWPNFQHYGFSVAPRTQKPLSWQQIEKQLSPRDVSNPCSFTPFVFAWKTKGGTGHMVAAIGYFTTPGGGRYLVVHDPLPVSQGTSNVPMLYDTYADKEGEQMHWFTYYNITKKN